MREVVVDGVRYVPDHPRLPPDGMTLGEYLLAARQRNGKQSLEKAAAGIGIAKSYLWTIEQKSPDIGLAMALRIATYYGLDLNEMAACCQPKQEEKSCS